MAGGKVLFIDDQRDFLELLKIRLKDEEYEKHFLDTTDGVEEYIRERDIDVVVSDMNMPKNGIELFKSLRESNPNVVRIALSGSLNTGSLLMAINEGDVYKYIPKPWKVDSEGREVIKRAIDYSKYLKFKFYCDCDTDVVSMETLEVLLKNLDTDYEIIERKDAGEDCLDLNLKYVLRIKR